MTDRATDSTGPGGRAGLRTLFEDAVAGLNPGAREIIELRLRQGLEAGDVAVVLGVSRLRARWLLARAEDQLEACLGVLLVGRAGRDQCRKLRVLLAGWDGRLTAALRDRVRRHIGRCPTCAGRRARELAPARLRDLTPGAALAAGAAESFRRAAAAPPALRARTLALACGRAPGAAGHRAGALTRAANFTRPGFPSPARAPGTGLTRPRGFGARKPRLRFPRRGPAGAAAVAVLAAVLALAAGSVRPVPESSQRPPASVFTPRPSAATPAWSVPGPGFARSARRLPAAGRPGALGRYRDICCWGRG